MFAFILLIGIVSASAPNLGVFQIDREIELKQTCTINGTFCDLCNISSVDYPNGSIVVSDISMTKRNAGDFNYTLIGASVSTLGKYRVSGFCDYGSDVRKTWVYYFDVTYTGEKVSLSNGIIVIAFLILAIICLVLGYNFQMDYWLMKTFFYFCSVLAGILAINSAKIIASESLGLSRMGNMGLLIGVILFSVFFIVMFVFTFIEIIKALRHKKNLRWEMD